MVRMKRRGPYQVTDLHLPFMGILPSYSSYMMFVSHKGSVLYSGCIRSLQSGVWIQVVSFPSPSRLVRPRVKPNLLPKGYRRDVCPEIKRLRREAVHSPPLSTKAKEVCSYVARCSVRLHCVVLESVETALPLYNRCSWNDDVKFIPI